MPILDGIEASKLIREYEQSALARIAANEKLAAYGRIPIVAVSASLSEQRVREYIDAGFDGWILKPIDFKRLEALLTAVRDEQTRGVLLYGIVRWEKGGWFKMQKDDPPIL
jgi:CheY-like chemotaxis protein